MNKERQENINSLRSKISESEAYARLASLFDEGTFVEIGKFVKRRTTEFDNVDGNEFEGVITGYGAVDGRLVFAYAQDFSRMKGAMGEAHAKKIVSLYDLAIKNGAPIVGFLDSAGAKVLEGVAALSGYGAILKTASKASGIIPQIAVVCGLCTGSMAAVASMCDIVIGTRNCKLYVNPPFITGGKDAGSAEAAAKNGVINILAEDASDAVAKTKALLLFLPSNNNEGTVYALPTDDATRSSADVESIISNAGYDVRDVINVLIDNANFVELSKEYAQEIVCGLGLINGITSMIVATNPKVNGGRLTPGAARKAAKYVTFADSFNIPLLTLVDTEGFDASYENEKAPYSNDLAKLAFAYASSTNAKVTVTLGASYGAAFTLLGSKALGADLAYALESAKISIMPISTAVEFAWGDEIMKASDPNAKRAELETEWANTMASPVEAARNGDIDDVLLCDELRAKIASALEMLSSKSQECPTKKHGNMPV